MDKIFKDTDIKYFQTSDQIILKNSKTEKKQEKINKGKPIDNETFINKNNDIVLAYLPQDKIRLEDFISVKIIDDKKTDTGLLETEAQPEPAPLSFESEISVPEVKSPRGKHHFSISPGLKTNSSTNIQTTTTSVSTSMGVTGSVSYGYMFSDEWQFNIQTGVFVTQASVTTDNLTAKSIIPFIFGIRYYPVFLNLSDAASGYIGAGLGAYVGFSSNISSNLSTVSGAETKLGANFNAGIDFFPFKWFKLGPNIVYHSFGNYTKIIQESKNFSGAEFCLVMGLVL